jgi:hypothetical protein
MIIGHSRWSLCACLLLSASLGSQALGDSPWQRMSLFKKIEADEKNSFPLTENNGPWMIMAYTFSGDTSAEDARALVHELRSVHKLPAWSYQMTFDFGGTYGKGVDRFGGARKMKYRVSKSNEVAVLVGEFATLDDPVAKKTLERVRTLQCQSLNKERASPDEWQKDRSIKGWRALKAMSGGQQLPPGPLAYAFLASNPMIPDDYFKPKGIDKMIVDMNRSREIKYSLLDCKGRYTVRVATYAPPVIPILGEDPKKEAEAEKCLKGTLEEAAEKAHKVCEALRAKGYEAYEFHDRHSSIVTVGSFDSVGTPRPDGKIEINPQIHLIMNTFGANKQVGGSAAPTVGDPKKLDSVGGAKFDVQPLPVEVPRQTISGTYQSVSR